MKGLFVSNLLFFLLTDFMEPVKIIFGRLTGGIKLERIVKKRCNIIDKHICCEEVALVEKILMP